MWLSLSLFFTGGTGLISQYILATISSYLTGNTVEQFSITVAVMMGMMGIGSLWQKRFDDKNLAQVFIAVEVTLSLLVGFSPLIVYWAYTTDFYGVFYFLVVAMTGFLIGLEIPLIIRINKTYMPEIKHNVGWVFSLDYFGAMIGGGIIWTFVILPHVNIMQAGFIAGGMNLLVAVITWYAIRGKGEKKTFIIFVFLAILMTLGGYFAPKWENVLEQKMYEDPVISVANTPYQHIVMTKRKDDLRMYINGNIQFSSKDEKRYHDFLVHPVMNMVKHPESVLVFGGGDGLAMREINKYIEKGLTKDAVLVDIDKKMIDYASTNRYLTLINNNSFSGFQMLDNADIHNLKGKTIVISDATAFVNKLNRQNGKKFNVVIMDLPDPSNLSVGKMYSLEFFKGLYHLMDKDGALVIQSSSPFFVKDVYLSIGKTLKVAGYKDVVPYRFNIPSFGEWGWWIACKEECRLPHSFKVETNFITPELFVASTLWGKNELKGNAQVNSLTHPVIVDMYQKSVWE